MLSQLGAGALRMVRFTQVSELPLRDRYQLVISVAPVPGESETGNNSRTLDSVVRNSM